MRGPHRFVNPTRFMRVSATILPWTAWLAVGLLALGLYPGLLVAPADYQQGPSARIMFVHVKGFPALCGTAI